jgi:alkanesulfonate monooxygenase SsuD/methylene tetrahydromethanopterin reductase-like flavin-dependent oxidoreductase (luciferase family)
MTWVGLHIVSHRTLGNRDIVACIALADNLGYDGVTLNEDVGHDAFALLSVAATRTRRVLLGTAITNVYVRTALQVAMGAVTLDDLSDGRAQLGLSVGHHPWNDLYHGVGMDAPLARLREYVAYIRKAVTGEQFDHQGSIYTGIRARLDQVPVSARIPIHIAGEGPRILALAGEIADGAILNISTPWYLREVAVPQLRAGAERAGRDLDAIEITSVVTCCVGDDRAALLRDARAAFMERLSGSGVHIVRGQPPDVRPELERLRQLIHAGEPERASEELRDDVVTSLIATGRADEVRMELHRHVEAGSTRVLVAPFPRTRAVIEKTLQALAPDAIRRG